MICILLIYATSSQVPTFKDLLNTFNACCNNTIIEIPTIVLIYKILLYSVNPSLQKTVKNYPYFIQLARIKAKN